MIEQHWAVISVCRKCNLTMQVDLRVIAIVKGPQTVLWNHQGRCKRVGCDGVVEFQAKPPELLSFIRLFADWPEGIRLPE